MAIGRTFKEALQKGIRSLEISRFGLGYDGKDLPDLPPEELKAGLITPNSQRLFYLRQALRDGLGVQEICELTKIDPWFLENIRQIIAFERDLQKLGSVAAHEDETLRRAKSWGFSDKRLSVLLGTDEKVLRERRYAAGVHPVYKTVDTCGAEFAAHTPYLYSSYDAECEAEPTDRKKVIILGGGPNRIGQGIEFDY